MPGDAWGHGDPTRRSLTSEVLACSVVLVMDPLRRWWVEVGLGGSEAQGVVAGPHRQADVEGVWGDDAILIHQSPCSQLWGQQGWWLEEWWAQLREQTHCSIPSPLLHPQPYPQAPG